MQPDALGSFPYFVVLGFGMVWMTLSTLGFIWFATWRSARAPRVAAADGQRPSLTRRRLAALVGAGALGGLVVGAVAGALANASARERAPRGAGRTTP